MGVGGSSVRQSSDAEAVLESAVFQQRSQDTTGLQPTRGVSVDDGTSPDFLDISYSEGGGIMSPKDMANSSSQYHNHPNKGSGLHSNSSSALAKQKTQVKDISNSLPDDINDNNNFPADFNKENSTPDVGEDGFPMVSDASSVILPSEQSTCVRQRIQRAQSHDVRMTSTGTSPIKKSVQERSSLVIERRTSEMSFLITPPPPEHPASPDLVQFGEGIEAGIHGGSDPTLQHRGQFQGDLRVEEVV